MFVPLTTVLETGSFMGGVNRQLIARRTKHHTLRYGQICQPILLQEQTNTVYDMGKSVSPYYPKNKPPRFMTWEPLSARHIFGLLFFYGLVKNQDLLVMLWERYVLQLELLNIQDVWVNFSVLCFCSGAREWGDSWRINWMRLSNFTSANGMAHKASWISSSKNVCCGFLKNMCPYYYSDQQKVWRMLYEMNLQR